MRLLQWMVIGVLALSAIGIAIAQPPAIPVTDNPQILAPDEAARRAFELCLDHALGEVLIVPAAAPNLRSKGFELVEPDPHGMPGAAIRARTTRGVVEVFGQRDGNCNITTTGSPTAPIEKALTAQLEKPQTFALESSGVSAARTMVWRWQRPGRNVRAIVAVFLDNSDMVSVSIGRLADSAPVTTTIACTNMDGDHSISTGIGLQRCAPVEPVTADATPCVDRAGKVITYPHFYSPGNGISFLTCSNGALPLSALSLRRPVPARIVQGLYPMRRDNILKTLQVRPLDQIGEDVIRFSVTPSLSGGGWVIELHRDGQGASGTRRTLPSGVLRRAEQAVTVPISLSRAEYYVLAAQYDMLMAKDEPDMRADEFSVTGCLDGSYIVAERRIGGRRAWREGACDGPREEHPNTLIARLMARIGS